MVATVNARVAQSGAVPLAKSSAAADNNCNTSGSSRQTRNTSLVQPPGPEALPNGALRKHSAKIFLSNSKGALGWKFNTAGGISLSTSWGRHRCNSVRVASFWGASAAPTKAWRARDTCPCWTRIWAWIPLRTRSASSWSSLLP